jgi:glycosyltransferase involved in cell wall biosynthesis
MVIGEKALQRKIVGVNRGNRDIKLVYFGRIVEYKGISDMILAVQHLSADLEANNAGYSVSLTIIGTGEHSPELEKLAAEKEMSAHIIFKDAIPYGPELFKVLQECDFLLAAPKHEDTPRSAFDAMACALPIIAYDTYYYEDLEKTGAVKTVPWCSIESLAEKIKELANQPDIVIDMMKKGKEFAIDNTQEIWIEKRKAWTDEFLS